MNEDDILAEIEAEETRRTPQVFAKEYTFAVTPEEEEALLKPTDKQWTMMQGVLHKRGAYDLDLYDGRIIFALTTEQEYLLDEITAGINEQLDDITGRRLKDTEAWGMF